MYDRVKPLLVKTFGATETGEPNEPAEYMDFVELFCGTWFDRNLKMMTYVPVCGPQTTTGSRRTLCVNAFGNKKAFAFTK